MKLASVDARRYIADPDRRPVPTDELLSKQYAATRRALIGEQALTPEPGNPRGSDTVYLCAADSEGMMVSFIQSTFDGFGSHVVVPGTGIVLQNRGAGFSLDPAHPNVLEPAKRPFHTLIPGFLSKDGAPIGPFGVMGGNMQPQGHLQMVVNTIDHHMDPQTSLDQPRWYWHKDRTTLCEPLVDPVDTRQRSGTSWTPTGEDRSSGGYPRAPTSPAAITAATARPSATDKPGARHASQLWLRAAKRHRQSPNGIPYGTRTRGGCPTYGSRVKIFSCENHAC
jgi:gamma-glutamyltranspeptidase